MAFVNMLKNHVFTSFNLNISEKYRLLFEDIFLGTLDTCTKKNEPTLDSFVGGGVHGKVCWLIAYLVSHGIPQLSHGIISYISIVCSTV